MMRTIVLEVDLSFTRGDAVLSEKTLNQVADSDLIAFYEGTTSIRDQFFLNELMKSHEREAMGMRICRLVRKQRRWRQVTGPLRELLEEAGMSEAELNGGEQPPRKLPHNPFRRQDEDPPYECGESV